MLGRIDRKRLSEIRNLLKKQMIRQLGADTPGKAGIEMIRVLDLGFDSTGC